MATAQVTNQRETIQSKFLDILRRFGPQFLLFGLNIVQNEMVIASLYVIDFRITHKSDGETGGGIGKKT